MRARCGGSPEWGQRGLSLPAQVGEGQSARSGGLSGREIIEKEKRPGGPGALLNFRRSAVVKPLVGVLVHHHEGGIQDGTSVPSGL